MNVSHVLSSFLKCVTILLVVSTTTANGVQLYRPRNNLELTALFSFEINGMPRVWILFSGEILYNSLVPQRATCMCQVIWEKVITADGSVAIRPPEDWVSMGYFISFGIKQLMILAYAFTL